MIAALLVLGCGEPSGCDHQLAPAESAVGGEAIFEGYQPAGCVPDEAQHDAYVGGVIAEHCGACHGAEPDFGAPIGLSDYATLIEGEPGERLVDRIARRTAARTMPPGGVELPHGALDTLVEWATCGEVHPDHSVGLSASQPVYTADVDNFALPSFDLVADDFAVDPDTLDRYQCFAFDAPIDEDRFVKRMQVVVDESRVLHHVVLMSDPARTTEGSGAFECEDMQGDTPLLYAWAPGTDAFDFDDGGVRITPGDRLIVQIHYNNGAGLTDVRDRSGVRVFHGPVEDTEWSMLTLGPAAFAVPEGESAACSSTPVGEPMRFLAGLPHMHQLGVEVHSYVERASSGVTESIVDVTGYSFEAQRFYRYDLDLDAGDVLHTWCGYRNETGEPQQSGTGTSDEMCFHFVYASRR